MLFDPVYTNRFSSLIFGKNRGTTPPDGILLKKLPLIPLFLSICIDQYSNKEYICSRQQLPIQTNGEISMIDLCAIRRLQTSLRTFEKHLKDETGLSFNDALLLCAVNKGVTEPGLLAKELELSPSRLTRILDNLEARELARRELSSLDRRSILVTLTEKGKQMVEQYSCSEITLPADLEFTQN
jgi:DNA-binding MarR family transcriptional regulator